ncbi:hypothetical protein HYPSUDRAFT_59419 [Hypholoma sublateritium FD-334 SS-4]|uniref:Uncharacterized protein n=1 Tax=Hypholoma sublateritium (strain FD-334 SS-4) TaxID=945553 RepID=A0A0D2LU04_HYPSF|nr:hypothetical protein HYPSUDRAFT_59419 [Hypholoma sublateritium FD-334 SS-4]
MSTSSKAAKYYLRAKFQQPHTHTSSSPLLEDYHKSRGILTSLMKYSDTYQSRDKHCKPACDHTKKYRAASQAFLRVQSRITSPLAPGGNNLQATGHPAFQVLQPKFKRSKSLHQAALHAAMAATPMGREVLAGHVRLLLMTPKDHEDWDAYVYGTD